jgi:hypothetical protein
MIDNRVKLIALPIRNLCAKLGRVINATSQPPYPQWQRPCTHYTGGWVDLRAGLGGYREETLFSLTVARTLDRVTRIALLYRLRCPHLMVLY